MDSAQLIILLIDDNPVDVAVTAGVLQRQELCNVRIARGGQEALDYLFGHGHFANRRRHPLPHLILLDLNMPVVDGYAVLQRVKLEEGLRRIPVVILCMSEAEGKRAIEYGARANDYLVKPLSEASVQALRNRYENWTLRLDLPARAVERRRSTSGSR
jgi:two-component system, response regulator